MTAQTAFRRLRPTTLAAIAADLYEIYSENGDSIDYQLARMVRAELVTNAGADDAQRMILEAMQELTGEPEAIQFATRWLQYTPTQEAL